MADRCGKCCSKWGLHLLVRYLNCGCLNREYFRLLMQEISSNNALMCGAERRRTAIHNTALLQKKEYYYVGQTIALSLLYGGPGPHFFSDTAANYLLSLPITSIEKADIPDADIVEKINQVCFYSTEE